MEIGLYIYNHQSIYDVFSVSTIDEGNNENEYNDSPSIIFVPLNRKGLSAYTVSAYVSLLKSSNVYKKSAVKALQQLIITRSIYPQTTENNCQCYMIVIQLKMPSKQFLDYKWSERVTLMAIERKEIDYAMSWLSTLGGAFSAMGEQFQQCAHVAGTISMHQFKLAHRLGDPLLVARCQLYACLSYIQQGKFKIPRKLIPRIFKFAINNRDIHLQRMCQGIWAKLRYCYKLRKKE